MIKQFLFVICLDCIFAVVPLRSQSLDELWKSEGYGVLIEIHEDTMQVFETTSISCIPSWSARRISGSQGEIVYQEGRRTIRLSSSTGMSEKHLHVDGNASDIILYRISKRPKLCMKQVPNTPSENYAIFWQTFQENYPFFNLHHVDWDAEDKNLRSQVNETTKPEELFFIFRKLIAPLQDAHTGFEAGDLRRYFDGFRPDPNHLERPQWQQAVQIIKSRYVSDLTPYCREHIQFGALSEAIGYLRMNGFYDYSDDGTYAGNLQALRKALDAIFQNASRFHGVVIDVRQNNGGDDSLAIEIASRLTATKYLAYKKIARNNSADHLHFTKAQNVWVPPASVPGFTGGVVLLTGPDTVSAGETFTMALMGRKAHVTRIGLSTQGVFSDTLNRHLPNGWRFRLPNEIYLTNSGRAFDGSGIPPDVRIPFFTHEDLMNGRDAVLEKAIELLHSI